MQIRFMFCVSLVLLNYMISSSASAGYGLRSSTWLWRDGKIQYEFLSSCDENPATKRDVLKAMDLWQTKVGTSIIRFVEDKAFENRLRIECKKPDQNFAAGEAPVGYTHGASGFMRIDPYSNDAFGVALHELGHVLGLSHEQSRKDSANYILVNKGNIRDECLAQYDVEENFRLGKIGVFDFQSVMLYSSASCAINSSIPTATTLTGERFGANRSSPSQGDIDAVRSIFRDLLHTPIKKLDFAMRALQLVNNELTNCKVEIDGQPEEAGFERTGRPSPNEASSFLLGLRVRDLRSNRIVKSSDKQWIDTNQDIGILRYHMLPGMDQVFPGIRCFGNPALSLQVKDIMLDASSYNESGCTIFHTGVPYQDGGSIRTTMTNHGASCPNKLVTYLQIPEGASTRLMASQVAHQFQVYGNTPRPRKNEGTDQIPQASNVIREKFSSIILSADEGKKISGRVDCTTFAHHGTDITGYNMTVADASGSSRTIACLWDQVIPSMTSPVRITLSRKLKNENLSNLMLSFLHVEGSNEKVTVELVN